MPFFCFFASFVPLLINSSVSQIFIYSLPHSILFSLSIHYIYYINVWQVIYFYIICRYIKIKLNELKQIIILLNESRLKTNSSYIMTIITSFTAVFKEINEYNTSYWSKYLLAFWLIQGAITLNAFYLGVFARLSSTYSLFFIYGTIVMGLTFSLILNTAASVNNEVNKLFKHFNSLIANNVYNRRIYERTLDGNFENYLFFRNIKVYKNFQLFK